MKLPVISGIDFTETITVAAAQPWCAAQGIEQQPSMAAFVDARVAHSFESLAGAGCSPLPLRVRALPQPLRQARLPQRLGGAGIANATMLAPAAYVASRLACWRRMRAWFPLFAECDMLSDDHL